MSGYSSYLGISLIIEGGGTGSILVEIIKLPKINNK